MNQGNSHSFSPTGRLLDKHGVAVVHSMSYSRLTPIQRELLERLAGQPLVVNGREYSTSKMHSVFNGHQLPRDPEALRVMDIDYSRLEERVLAALGTAHDRKA